MPFDSNNECLKKPFPSLTVQSCNVRCMNGGSCAEDSCSCAKGYTGNHCGQRECRLLLSERTWVWVWGGVHTVSNAVQSTCVQNERKMFDILQVVCRMFATVLPLYAYLTNKSDSINCAEDILRMDHFFIVMLLMSLPAVCTIRSAVYSI